MATDLAPRFSRTLISFSSALPPLHPTQGKRTRKPARDEVRWMMAYVIPARAGMPLNFRPTHIGDDFVLGLGKDENDVEHVRMYPLLKSWKASPASPHEKGSRRWALGDLY